jgi:hypothetical protein
VTEFHVPPSAQAALAAREIEAPTADEIERAEHERVRALRESLSVPEGDLPDFASDDGRSAPARSGGVAKGVLSCSLCGVEIPSAASAYQKIIGWAQPRSQGGTNALRLRVPLDEYACAICIDIRQGQPHTQETLT